MAPRHSAVGHGCPNSWMPTPLPLFLRVQGLHHACVLEFWDVFAYRCAELFSPITLCWADN